MQRDLAADFVRAFGEETTSVPKLLAISLGADAGNTRGESLGFIANLEFTPDTALTAPHKELLPAYVSGLNAFACSHEVH